MLLYRKTAVLFLGCLIGKTFLGLVAVYKIAACNNKVNVGGLISNCYSLLYQSAAAFKTLAYIFCAVIVAQSVTVGVVNIGAVM